jgi:hypothetical protein
MEFLRPRFSSLKKRSKDEDITNLLLLYVITVTVLRIKFESAPRGRYKMNNLTALNALARAAEVWSFTIAGRQLSA